MTIPTIQQLYQQAISNIESELQITISPIGKSYLRAKAQVQAAFTWVLYLTIAKVQKNIFVDTCDEETLSRFGQVKLGRDRFPATQAQYSILVTGTTGAVIVAGTTWKANDDTLSPSKRYILDNDFTLDGTNLVTVRALEAGSDSILDIGNEMTLESPIALVDDLATVDTQVIQPQNAETIDAFRQAIILAFRLEPQGGAPSDYRLWSLEIQGIVNAYPYATSGEVNQVNLYIESDEVDGVPTAQDLQDVEDNIELPTTERPARKPATVQVNYLPVTPLNVNINIANFQNLTTEKENLIYSAIQAELSTVRPFVGSIDVLADRNDTYDTNKIIATIVTVLPGSAFGDVTLIVDGNTVNTFTFEFGDIPLLDLITYL